MLISKKSLFNLLGAYLFVILMVCSSPAQSIYIEESEVAPYLKLAEEYEKLGKWREAIEQYQFLLKKHPDALCYRKSIKSLNRYLGLKQYCLEKLSQYPPEGIKTYRAMFNTTSQAVFNHAVKECDETTLRRIVDEMFFTEYGDEAAYLLAEILSERGELSNALKHWNSILKSYPDTNLSIMTLLAKIALASKRSGKKSSYESALTQLKDLPDNSTIHLNGKELQRDGIIKHLNDLHLNIVLLENLPVKPWTTLGGNNTHNLAMISDSTNEKTIWKNNLVWKETPDEPEIKPSHDLFARFSLSPCIADDTVYINNGINIRSFNLTTGKFLRAYPPSWEETITYYKNLITSSTLRMSHVLFGSTLNNETLYANLLDGAKRTNNPGISGYSSYLTAVDAQTLKEQWNTKHTTDGVLSQINLYSPPLIYNDKVYSAGIKVSGIETQIYIGCFDSCNGRLLWSRFICARTQTGRQGSQKAITPILAETDGLLACLTNHGVIATLNASTGEIIWLIDYSKDEYSPNQKIQEESFVSYPIIENNTLACLPLYGTKVYGLNMADGKLRWHKQVNIGDVLLGVIDDILITRGSNFSGINITTGKMLWSPETMLLKNIPVYGPGCLSQKYIYLPCANGLMRIDRHTLKVLDNPPIAWMDPKDAAGTLMILDEQLIGISPLRISLFTKVK